MLKRTHHHHHSRIDVAFNVRIYLQSTYTLQTRIASVKNHLNNHSRLVQQPPYSVSPAHSSRQSTPQTIRFKFIRDVQPCLSWNIASEFSAQGADSSAITMTQVYIHTDTALAIELLHSTILHYTTSHVPAVNELYIHDSSAKLRQCKTSSAPRLAIYI